MHHPVQYRLLPDIIRFIQYFILCMSIPPAYFMLLPAAHSIRRGTYHKGHDGLSKTPVKNCEGVIVHDHDKSYYSYGSGHQECLAHVLRYLVGAIENEPNLTWHKQMHSLLQRMIHTAKRNRSGIPKEKIQKFTVMYEEILSKAFQEYQSNPPDKVYMYGYNLQKRMCKFRETFTKDLSHPFYLLALANH